MNLEINSFTTTNKIDISAIFLLIRFTMKSIVTLPVQFPKKLLNICYLIGYPNVWPFLTKVKKAAALQIRPMAAKMVSIVSNTPNDLGKSNRITF